MTRRPGHLELSVALGLALAGRGVAQVGGAHHAAPSTFLQAAPAELGQIGRRIAAANPGDTIHVDAGVYREHLRIDKPIKLIAKGLAILDGGGSGDIVEITAPDCTLQGFTIRNTGIDLDKENAAVRVLAPRATLEDNTLEDILFGIDLREAPDSVVRGNTIGGKKLDIARRGDGLRLWRSDRALVERNTIHDGRDAILWYSTGVIVRHNRAHDCRYGLHLMFSDQVSISENEFSNNSVGIYLMYSTGVELRQNRLIGNRGPSGYGIGLKETDQFSVRENLIVGNRAGVYIDGSPFTTTKPGEFTRNTLAYNDVGITFLPSARGNELTDNNFIDNIDQVSVAGRGSLEANRFWKGERGNFWSDYTGYDKNHDGIGDFVHESQTLFENLMDKEPALRLFLFSPAQQAIEFVGRAVPAVRPEAKFTDEVPLMRPVPVAFTPAGGGARWAGLTLAASGMGLLGLGGGIVAATRAKSPRRKRGGRRRLVDRQQE
jgi:nitrous oxidase accessory protein